VNVSEAASRVGKQVYHAGQGQDERAGTRPPHLLRGLDSAWCVGSNPHRESGTRWRAAADVGATRVSAGAAHGRQKGCDGNRLGDSVGAYTACTGERPRSAERPQRGVKVGGGLDSGGVLTRRMRPLGHFKGRGLIADFVHPYAVDDAHPDVGQGSDSHTVGFALRSFPEVLGQRPGFLQRRLPGELVQGVAQRFHARETFVRFSVIATLEGHWRGPSQSLHTGGTGIAGAVIAPFSEQTWGQTSEGTRQSMPQPWSGWVKKRVLIALSRLSISSITTSSCLTRDSIRRDLARIMAEFPTKWGVLAT
jgi:hypothetical protein